MLFTNAGISEAKWGVGVGDDHLRTVYRGLGLGDTEVARRIAGWLHQLTATTGPGGQLLGHGIRDGQAMIATLRHRLIRVPARLVRHAGALILRPPPGHHLLATILARLRALPAASDQAVPAPKPRNPLTRGDIRALEL